MGGGWRDGKKQACSSRPDANADREGVGGLSVWLDKARQDRARWDCTIGLRLQMVRVSNHKAGFGTGGIIWYWVRILVRIDGYS